MRGRANPFLPRKSRSDLRGRNLIIALALLLTLLIALPAAAAPLGRPVWWKVSNGGGATLWIMGIPDGMLGAIEWNQDALKHRLSLADAAVMPMLQGPEVTTACPKGQPPKSLGGLTGDGTKAEPRDGVIGGGGGGGGGGPPPIFVRPDAVRTFPTGDAAECKPVAWTINMVTPYGTDTQLGGEIYWDDPLSRRLSPDLLARVEKDLPILAGDPGSAARHARTMDLALWMDLWNWPQKGKGFLDDDPRLGNVVNFQALQIARIRGLQPVIVPQPRLWMPVYASVYQGEVTPPEALQQKCLEEVLDQTESGRMPAMRMAAQQAWADGDLDHALRRTGTVHYCLMGDGKSSAAQDYLKNAAYRYTTRLDKMFDKPGQIVAVIELDPLLLTDGGVLDHYRRLGYDISLSDGME